MTEPQAQPPTPATGAPAPRSRARRIAIQVVGIIIAIASLAWCIHMAFGPENQKQWSKLGQASTGQIALILGLSAAALILEGLSFWVILRPVHRIKPADVVATNALCTFLAYLPFKLSAITRFLIHNRRDGVPLPTIAAWFGNFGSIMLAVFLAVLGLLAIFKSVTPAYLASVGVACAIIAAGFITIGTIFRGPRGIDRLAAVLRALRLKRLEPLLRTKLWGNLHAGFDMHASAPCVIAAVVFRLAHAAVLTWRFVAVAAILGLAMPLHVAVPMAIVFFLIGAASPAGMAGIREAGVSGLAGLMLATSGQTGEVAAQYAPAALIVSATEALVFLACGGLGLAWLRPDRLLKLRAKPAA